MNIDIIKKIGVVAKEPLQPGKKYFSQVDGTYFFIEVLRICEETTYAGYHYDLKIINTNSSFYKDKEFVNEIKSGSSISWYLIEPNLIRKTEDILEAWV